MASSKTMRNVRRKKPEQKLLYARVPVHVHDRVVELIKSLKPGTQNSFVYQAVIEKLERSGKSTTELGPFSELSIDDRRRVEWYIRLLESSPDNMEFRESVESVCLLFEKMSSTH